MKKNIFLTGLIILMALGAKAYNQQSVSAYAGVPPTSSAYMGVTINNYAQLMFTANWNYLATGGNCQAYTDTLIGEYYWWEGDGKSKSYSVNGGSKYWSTIHVYLWVGHTIGASGTATISWW